MVVMIAELVAFFGLFILILFTFAELFKHKFLGLVASFLLLILAFIILIDGIQIASGTATTILQGAFCSRGGPT
jgi:hypothetical protein